MALGISWFLERTVCTRDSFAGTPCWWSWNRSSVWAKKMRKRPWTLTACHQMNLRAAQEMDIRAGTILWTGNLDSWRREWDLVLGLVAWVFSLHHQAFQGVWLVSEQINSWNRSHAGSRYVCRIECWCQRNWLLVRRRRGTERKITSTLLLVQGLNRRT